MKERPILFSGPMVKAILDGRKTQTRRFIKPQPEMELDGEVLPDGTGGCGWVPVWPEGHKMAGKMLGWNQCPYGKYRDRLWVRETFGKTVEDTVCYRADEPNSIVSRWRPSIHMPRWASRITLEITGIRVERLNDISREDAIAEGTDWKTCPKYQSIESFTEQRLAQKLGMACFPVLTIDYIGGYKKLWESINGPGSWDANPWVWVVEFKRV